MQPQDIARDSFELQADGHYAERVVVVPAPYTLNKYKHIQGANTYKIKPGAGKLIGLVINQAVSLSTITVYDNNNTDTLTSAQVIGKIINPLTLTAAQLNVNYNLDFNDGLVIVTNGADDITVVYR